jgi:hypothetical protein
MTSLCHVTKAKNSRLLWMMWDICKVSDGTREVGINVLGIFYTLLWVRLCISCNNVALYPFLAHLSWKLKWAILIACCPSSICLSVRKLLHFRLLLQNHWANFNQTWHKSSLGEGILNCSNEGDCPSPRGDNHKRVKIHWNLKKNLLLQNQQANFNKTWHKSSLGNGDSKLFK